MPYYFNIGPILTSEGPLQMEKDAICSARYAEKNEKMK